MPSGSVTEQSSLDDFLATAELSGTNFAAEKNTQLVFPTASTRQIKGDSEARQFYRDNIEKISIPRRQANREKVVYLSACFYGLIKFDHRKRV